MHCVWLYSIEQVGHTSALFFIFLLRWVFSEIFIWLSMVKVNEYYYGIYDYYAKSYVFYFIGILFFLPLLSLTNFNSVEIQYSLNFRSLKISICWLLYWTLKQGQKIYSIRDRNVRSARRSEWTCSSDLEGICDLVE